MKYYGKELILDVYDCDTTKFNRKDLDEYFRIICDNKIFMERETLCWWDYEGCPEEYATAPAHLKGTSAVQFIKTSNITVHTLDELKRIYVNIFSCKDFNVKVARDFTEEYFSGKTVNNNGKGRTFFRI